MSDSTVVPAHAAPSAPPASKKTAPPPITEAGRRESQQGLRRLCERCSGVNHIGPDGRLECGRLLREREIADANARPAEEAAGARAALFLPDRPDQVAVYDRRACPVTAAWDALETGAEPNLAAVTDSTVKFLAAGSVPPLA